MFTLNANLLPQLNSLTKYPSIPTYHKLDATTGGLLEEVITFEGAVYGTEKIDGCNGRIILTPDGSYVIGSREDLLTASGDLVHNAALGVVDALRPLAEHLNAEAHLPFGWDEIVVLYLEVYGQKDTSAWKNYGTGEASYRLFDVAVVDTDKLDWEVERISTWRKAGGQKFLGVEGLRKIAAECGVEQVPHLFEMDGADLPTSINDMYEFLQSYTTTTAPISGEPGRCEGFVLRSDGTQERRLAKVRHANYARTRALLDGSATPKRGKQRRPTSA